MTYNDSKSVHLDAGQDLYFYVAGGRFVKHTTLVYTPKDKPRDVYISTPFTEYRGRKFVLLSEHILSQTVITKLFEGSLQSHMEGQQRIVPADLEALANQKPEPKSFIPPSHLSIVDSAQSKTQTKKKSDVPFLDALKEFYKHPENLQMLIDLDRTILTLYHGPLSQEQLLVIKNMWIAVQANIELYDQLYTAFDKIQLTQPSVSEFGSFKQRIDQVKDILSDEIKSKLNQLTKDKEASKEPERVVWNYLLLIAPLKYEYLKFKLVNKCLEDLKVQNLSSGFDFKTLKQEVYPWMRVLDAWERQDATFNTYIGGVLDQEGVSISHIVNEIVTSLKEKGREAQNIRERTVIDKILPCYQYSKNWNLAIERDLLLLETYHYRNYDKAWESILEDYWKNFNLKKHHEFHSNFDLSAVRAEINSESDAIKEFNICKTKLIQKCHEILQSVKSDPYFSLIAPIFLNMKKNSILRTLADSKDVDIQKYLKGLVPKKKAYEQILERCEELDKERVQKLCTMFDQGVDDYQEVFSEYESLKLEQSGEIFNKFNRRIEMIQAAFQQASIRVFKSSDLIETFTEYDTLCCESFYGQLGPSQKEAIQKFWELVKEDSSNIDTMKEHQAKSLTQTIQNPQNSGYDVWNQKLSEEIAMKLKELNELQINPVIKEYMMLMFPLKLRQHKDMTLRDAFKNITKLPELQLHEKIIELHNDTWNKSTSAIWELDIEDDSLLQEEIFKILKQTYIKQLENLKAIYQSPSL